MVLNACTHVANARGGAHNVHAQLNAPGDNPPVWKMKEGREAVKKPNTNTNTNTKKKKNKRRTVAGCAL